MHEGVAGKKKWDRIITLCSSPQVEAAELLTRDISNPLSGVRSGGGLNSQEVAAAAGVAAEDEDEVAVVVVGGGVVEAVAVTPEAAGGGAAWMYVPMGLEVECWK